MNKLTLHTPADALTADRTAVNSLTHSAGLKVEEEYTSDFDLKGYQIINTISNDKLEELSEAIKATMAPAEDNDIAQALLKMRALMSHKNDGGDLDIILEAFVEKLKDYPKDAVLESLTRIPNQYKWFPSWVEIKEDVEFRCQHRRLILKAIERTQYEQANRAILREVKQQSA